ncbi:MAG: DNA-binding protein [Deltaproteobacteria bacterium]|nr:DNA-binding protein [Deltaproteobacteria bacterium]
MKKEGGKSRVLFTDKLHIESKTLFVDFKENDGGRFLQIAELSNARRSTVVIPSSGLNDFMATLQKIAGQGLLEAELNEEV